MSNWLGKETKKLGNYFPQPVPSYTPTGYHRCEHCNRLMKDGRECDCQERENQQPEHRKVEVKKFDWRVYGERKLKEQEHGRDGKRNGAGKDVLGPRNARNRSDRDANRAGGNGLVEKEKGLKPCPFCGERKLAPRLSYGKYKVRCTKCATVYGPAGNTPDEARELWNRRKA